MFSDLGTREICTLLHPDLEIQSNLLLPLEDMSLNDFLGYAALEDLLLSITDCHESAILQSELADNN